MHEPIRKFWFADNPYITCVFNALSMPIPEIERFIVRSTQAALPHVKDEYLRKAVEILSHEEEGHARVHDTYNNLIRKQGYVISKHEAFEHATSEFFDRQSVKTRLIVCLCSEFFTAILGRHMLEKKVYATPGIDERMRALWTWHSLEELHHRGTAFDLYLDQGGGYFRRTAMMLVLTVRWIAIHFSAVFWLIMQSKVPLDLKKLWQMAVFLYGPQGFYMSVVINWFAFFKPGFHPKKDIKLEEGLDHDLHHFHVEKHFVEVVEASQY